MDHKDHVYLIEKAVPSKSGKWADLGSGDGAFTLALANCLDPQMSTIYSLDTDEYRLERQKKEFSEKYPNTNVIYLQRDFTKYLEITGLDGILMANSLHFTEDKVSLLKKLINYLKSSGRLVLVEYNADKGNSYVPYPISFQAFEKIAKEAGFNTPQLVKKIYSSFMNEIYCAVAVK